MRPPAAAKNGVLAMSWTLILRKFLDAKAAAQSGVNDSLCLMLPDAGPPKQRMGTGQYVSGRADVSLRRPWRALSIWGRLVGKTADPQSVCFVPQLRNLDHPLP